MITTGDNIDSKIKYYIGIFSILVLIFSIMPSFVGISGIFYLIGTFIVSFYLLKKLSNDNKSKSCKCKKIAICYYNLLSCFINIVCVRSYFSNEFLILWRKTFE